MATKKVVFEIDIKGSKEVLELQKRIKELKKDLAKTDDPTVADQLLTELAKLQTELKKAQAEAKKAQLEFQAKDSTIGSYKQLSAQLILAREKYKNLAAEAAMSGKANKEAIEKARMEAVKLDMQLRRIDASTGVFGRNVGNYAGSLKGLFGSLKNTIQSSGFLGRGGIGNLITMIKGGFESLQKVIDGYNETFNETALISKRVAAATEDVVSEYTKERVTLDTLTSSLYDEKVSRDDKEAALKKLQELYPDYFNNIDLDNLKTEQLTAAYAGANKQLLENIKMKTREKLLTEALADSATKQLQAQKDADQVSGDLGEQIAKNGDLTTVLANNITSFFSTAQAETAKAAVNVGQIDKVLDDLLKNVEGTIPALSANFGNLDAILKDTNKEITKDTKDNEKKRRAEYEKTLQEAKKAQEQFTKERAQFEERQAKAFTDLQNNIKQALIDNIEDEGKKAVAQEKFNNELRKAERKQQLDDLIKDLKEQEEKAAKLYGENAKETIDLRNKNAKMLTDLQASYDKLTEQESITHQNALTAIEKEGQQKRIEQEESSFQAQIEAQQTAFAEIERGYELQVLEIQEAVAKGTKTIEQGEKDRIEAQKKAIQEQIDLTEKQLENRLFASEEERQGLVLQKQRLKTELAQIEGEITAKANEEEEKRQKKTKETLEKTLGYISQAANAIGGLFDAIYAKELKQLEDQKTAREANIANLEEQLEDATGIERAYLEQKIEDETNAAEAIAAEAERTRKNAAKAQKAVAITQSIISGLLAVNNTLASIPFPANVGAAIGVGLLAAVQTASIIAQPLATGGIVGKHINGTPIQRSNGDNVLTTLKTGEVVLNEQQQALIGSDALTFAGVPGFASGGVVASVPSLPPAIGREVERGNELKELIMAVNSRFNRIEVQYTPTTDKAVQNDRKDRIEIKTTATL